MTKRKNELPSRLRWFRFDVDLFFDDKRMQQLTTREKSFWAMMLAKSFRQGGNILADTDIIVDNTGATEKEATRLLNKLTESGLLKSINSFDSINMVSPMMVEEHQKAIDSYELKRKAGERGGLKKSINKHQNNLIEGSTTTPFG